MYIIYFDLQKYTVIKSFIKKINIFVDPLALFSLLNTIAFEFIPFFIKTL